MSNNMLNIDTDAIAALVTEEAKTSYGDMWKKLRKDQQELFTKLTRELAKEYMAYTFGPAADKPKHEANLASLKNGMAALENVAGIRAYRTTMAMIGRIIVAIVKSTAKAAIGL